MAGIGVSQTVHDRLVRLADAHPDHAFVRPLAGQPLTLGRLGALARDTGAVLADAGVGPHDRVALLCADRALATSAFLSAICAAGTAPLNQRLTVGELIDALDVPAVKIVLTDQGPDHPIWQAARQTGRPVLHLVARPDEGAGAFRIDRATPAETDAAAAAPAPEEIGLVLSTSGTTAKPKRVPLSNRNITSSVDRLAAWLQLGPDDCVLSVMPLFHIHGIICTILTPLLSGGSIQLIDRVTPDLILDALETRQATWCTAVPTIYQAVHNTLAAGTRAVPDHRLRFLRSSSAAMPPPLLQSLERTFGVPVLEAYGMTEATHQMASNPLPPAERRAGAVGVAASVEIAIMDADGALLPTGRAGEVVIRGPSVTAGYEDNPEANRKSYTDGWFRTGDEGVLDAAGYLTLTGRLKEMINRGGEKIAPLEVDRALAEFPAVREAISFAVPHPSLGEDVAAAVVPKPGQEIDQAALRNFLGARLAPFKIPQRFVVLDELPKGATGKLQRVGLADRLGITAGSATAEDGRDAYRVGPLEAAVCALWGQALRRPFEAIDPEASLVILGGDSLMAVQLTLTVEEVFGVRLGWAPIEMAGATVASTAAAITGARAAATATGPAEAADLPSPIEGRPNTVPATAAQRFFWDESIKTGDDPANTAMLALHISGLPGPDPIVRALDAVVGRHEGLRTQWAVDGGGLVQIVHPPAAISPQPLTLASIDQVQAAAAGWQAAPLPPSTAPWPWTVRLGRLDDGSQVLVVCLHHIVVDGTGLDLLVEALVDRLDGSGAGPADRPASPADLAVWEDRWWAGGADPDGIAFWEGTLRRVFDAVAARAAAPAPPSQAAALPLAIGPADSAAIEDAAKRHRCTPFVLLLAAFTEALAAVIKADAPVVSVPLANRTFRHTLGMIGCLFHETYLVAEGAGSGDRTRLLGTVRETLDQALRHQNIPVARVRDERFGGIGPAQGPAQGPTQGLTGLTDAYVQVRPSAGRRDWQVGPATVRRLGLETAYIPARMLMFLERSADGFVGELAYRTALFPSATAESLRDHFAAVVGQWCRQS